MSRRTHHLPVPLNDLVMQRATDPNLRARRACVDLVVAFVAARRRTELEGVRVEAVVTPTRSGDVVALRVIPRDAGEHPAVHALCDVPAVLDVLGEIALRLHDAMGGITAVVPDLPRAEPSLDDASAGTHAVARSA